MTEVYPKCWYCIRTSCRHAATVVKSQAPICIVHVLHTIRSWRTVYAMHFRGLACISVRVGAATLGLQQAKDLEDWVKEHMMVVSMAFDICKLLSDEDTHETIPAGIWNGFSDWAIIDPIVGVNISIASSCHRWLRMFRTWFGTWKLRM